MPVWVPYLAGVAVATVAAWRSPAGPVRRYRLWCVAAASIAVALLVVAGFFALAASLATPLFGEPDAADYAEQHRYVALAIASVVGSIALTVASVVLFNRSERAR